MTRILGLILLITTVIVLNMYKPFDQSLESSTIALGFLISCAYIAGQFAEKIKLPKITGYIIVGLLFGPYIFDIITTKTLADLHFINHMALALIAFYAGGELQLSHLKMYKKSFSIIIASQVLIAIGIMLILFLTKNYFDIFSGKTNVQIIVFAILLGVVCIARSPSTVIAIINETRSEGRVTDIVLGVTIALDVLVIMLFAIVISLSDLLLSSSQSWDFSFFLMLAFEIVFSILAGWLLGIGLDYLLHQIKSILPMAILTIGFLVTKFSFFLTDYLEHQHDIGVKIEPLLICITAGFYIQNYSKYNQRFMRSLDKVSLLIYTLFFSLTGATINLKVLQLSWAIAVVIFTLRLIMLAFSTTTGAILSKDPTPQRYLYWLGFVAQAGVSLGFAHEIVRRFPSFGTELASIIIAVVAIDQLIGPITFKYALIKSDETRERITYRALIKNRSKGRDS